MTTRPLLRLLLAVAITAAVPACTATDPEPPRPGECAGTVAFMGALSGGNAGFVLPTARGARLAVEQFAADNPQCAAVELRAFDTEGDPAKAAAVAQKIARDQDFLGVIGGAFSGETRQTKTIFDAAGVTMISPSATATDLTMDDPAGVFHRVVGHDEIQGQAIATYLTQVLHATTVFVVDDGTAYGGPLATKVVAEVSTAATVTRDRVQEKQTDFSATITKIKASGPDAVFYAGYAAEAGPFIRQLRTAGISMPFIGGDGLFGVDFPQVAGRHAEGAVITCPCLPPSEVAGDFAADYERRFSERPGAYAGEGFDAARIFLEAIKAGNTTRAAVESYVDAYDAAGVTKHIKFDARGDIDRDVVVIWAYRIRDGRPVPDREIPLQ